MKRLRILLRILPLIAGALACTLTASPTPTFIPPPTVTPPGYVPATATLPATATPEGPSAALPRDPRIVEALGQVEADRLLINVDALQNFNTRFVNANPNSADQGIGGAARWILNQFMIIEQDARARGVPFTVERHTFAFDWRGLASTQTNVVAYLTGAGHRVNEVIVVGAHYDTINEFGDIASPAPGADDNASGVAAMLEIARIMAQTQPRATVIFVAFSAEETGRQGSAAFLEDIIQSRNLDLRAMINLDTVGAQMLPDGQVIEDRARLFSAPPIDSPSRKLARAVEFVASAYAPGFTLDVQSTVDREGRWGDHMTFSDAGYPAVRLIESAEDPERSNTTRDTMDRIAPGYVTRVTRAALAALMAMAGGPAAPADLTVTPDPGTGSAAPTFTVTWTPAPGAVGYVFALRPPESPTYTRAFYTTAAGRFQTDRETFAGAYDLAVTAVDADGRQGPFIEVRIPR